MLQTQGKVIIAGAGPGDPELLTIKAVRWLQRADVVLTDRLVSPDILTSFVRPSAEIIFVGKQSRKGASTPQQEINELLVFHAAQGKLVVRLKGGDVSIFSNVLDELETLVAHGIPYEIVPGITAALGAAACSGIPLTARGHATAVRLLTCYQPQLLADNQWKELAKTDDTLVFYMSGDALPFIAARLRENGIAAGKLLALVEQATTPQQRVSLFDLQNDAALQAHQPASPSLLIVGKVVALHRQFAWVMEGRSTEDYFLPVAARLLAWEEEQDKQLQTA